MALSGETGYLIRMAGDGELKKIRKDLQRNREEIAALQRRIQALIEKRRAQTNRKSGQNSSPPDKEE
jgi:hypothetical protein